MTMRNAPLKFTDDQPVIGRYYPRGCTQSTMDNGDLYVRFDGVGYAWTAPTKKFAFTAGATVEFNQDFECDSDDTMYAHFPVRQASTPSFTMGTIEMPLTAIIQGMVPQLASSFGQQVIRAQLSQGFTVIRDTDNNVDFGMGVYHPPARPSHPFNVPSGSRLTTENLRVEVHTGERDFIGPIYVEDANKTLYVTATLDSVRAIDVFVMSADEGAASLTDYLAAPQAGPLRYPLRPPPYTAVLQQGMQYVQAVPVPAGYWYVVLDNTATAGYVSPPPSLFEAPPAVVSYVVQIGDTN
jgi:hypothetical protein